MMLFFSFNKQIIIYCDVFNFVLNKSYCDIYIIVLTSQLFHQIIDDFNILNMSNTTKTFRVRTSLKSNDVVSLNKDELLKYIETHSEGYEIISGPCLPYLDFDLVVNNEDEVKNQQLHWLKRCMFAITLMTPSPDLQITVKSACGFSASKQVWKISFHFIIHGVGFYPSGSDFKKSIDPIFFTNSKLGVGSSNLRLFDHAVYKSNNKDQLFRLIHTSKCGDDRPCRLTVVRKGDIVVYDACSAVSIMATMITNISGEKPADCEPFEAVEFDTPKRCTESKQHDAPTVEQIRNSVMSLGSHRVDDWEAWRNVILALGHTGHNYEMDLSSLAHEFSKQSPKYNAYEVSRVFNGAPHYTEKPITFGSIVHWLKEDNPDKHAAIFMPIEHFASVINAVKNIDAPEPRLDDLAPEKAAEPTDPAYKKAGEWHYADWKYFKKNKTKVKAEELAQYFEDSIIHASNEGNSIIFSKNNMPDGTVKYTPMSRVPFQTTMDNFKVSLVGSEECSMGNLYREHYQNKSFDYVDFVPWLKTDPTPSNVFNKFPGFRYPFKKLTPDEYKEACARVKIITDHIDIIGGEHADLMFDFLCDIGQNPGRKPKICFVVKSAQGAGKNILFEFIMRLIGKGMTNMFQEINQLTNKFNSRLEGSLFNCGNEVSNYAGHKIADALKARVIDDDITIELKGINTYDVRDFARYVLLSNNDFCIRVDPGCRRYVIVESSPVKIGDTKWFDDLAKCMEDHAQDFWNVMCNRDISDFNPYMKAPMSEVKREIMMDSISPAIQFMIAIGNGEVDQFITSLDSNLTVQNTPIRFDEDGELKISGKQMYEAFREWVGSNLPGRNTMSVRQFVKDLGKIGMDKKSVRVGGKPVKGYQVSISNAELEIGTYLKDASFKFDS